MELAPARLARPGEPYSWSKTDPGPVLHPSRTRGGGALQLARARSRRGSSHRAPAAPTEPLRRLGRLLGPRSTVGRLSRCLCRNQGQGPPSAAVTRPFWVPETGHPAASAGVGGMELALAHMARPGESYS